MVNSPYGGKLINRQFHDFKVNPNDYLKIKINPDIVLNVEQIATGAFSPLEGFMNSKDLDLVLNHRKLSNGLTWTIPIILPIPEEKVEEVRSATEILLVDEKGDYPVALLEVEDVYTFDKLSAAEKVFLTTDKAHPGVNYFLNLSDYFVGGKIKQINPIVYDFPDFMLTPKQTRQYFEMKGWKTICGFQTRNVPHCAHEHHQRIALEIVDGLFIQPLIGWKKVGDFKPAAIIRSYQSLINNYYPKNKVLLGTLSTAMFYAGPREAVFHAIIRKNFGCTHFIVGGDHAGVGNYYGTYDAHKIFDEIPDLGIKILKFKRSFYCHKTKSAVTEDSCGTDKKYHEEISGSKIRSLLKSKSDLDGHLMRPEVLAVLSEEDIITEEDLK